MRRQSTSFELALSTTLLFLAACGTFKLLFDMNRLGMYPWQSQTATIEAPPGCDAIVYSAQPPATAPKCKITEGTK
jgi:hypothetical protein